MGITFNQIPLVVNTPGMFAEFDSSRAARGLPPLPHVALIIGQMLATGSAQASTPVLVDTAESAIQLFGPKSMLAQAVKAYKAVDPLTELWAIPLADAGGGVAATGSITWAGTATEAGEQAFYIGGRRVTTGITVGMTATVLETNLLAALALQTDLPVTVAGNTGTGIDVVAVHKGTAGNGIKLGVALTPGERILAGFTYTVTQPAAGATDPDFGLAVTAMGEDQYHTIALCTDSSTEVAKLITEMESRWNAMRSIDGQLFVSKADTFANLGTLGPTYNSVTLSIVGREVSGLTPLPWEVTARAAAVSASQTQIDPAQAVTGLMLGGASAHRGVRFTRAQRDTLLGKGISTVMAASDGRMAAERFITTYQKNAANVPDTAYMDLFTVRTLSALRYTLRVLIGTKFARFKLADDGNEQPGQPIATPKIVRTEVLAWYKACLEDRGWVENFETFEKQLIVERDQSDPNRLNMFVPPDCINNFLVGAMKIAFTR